MGWTNIDRGQMRSELTKKRSLSICHYRCHLHQDFWVLVALVYKRSKGVPPNGHSSFLLVASYHDNTLKPPPLFIHFHVIRDARLLVCPRNAYVHSAVGSVRTSNGLSVLLWR